MSKLFMPVSHEGLIVGHPVDGFGFDSHEIRCENRPEIIGRRIFNKPRGSYSVFVNGEIVGAVHPISGGRFLGFDLHTKEISNRIGTDAEFKVFADVAIAAI